MRHFIILGFGSNSNADPGEVDHLGVVRSEAIALLNKPNDKYKRKELYELAVPAIRRFNQNQKNGLTVAKLKEALDKVGVEYPSAALRPELLELYNGI